MPKFIYRATNYGRVDCDVQLLGTMFGVFLADSPFAYRLTAPLWADSRFGVSESVMSLLVGRVLHEYDRSLELWQLGRSFRDRHEPVSEWLFVISVFD